jgi:hypothetical protein
MGWPVVGGGGPTPDAEDFADPSPNFSAVLSFAASHKRSYIELQPQLTNVIGIEYRKTRESNLVLE